MSEWVCDRCKSINRDAAITCYKCGSARGAVAVGDVAGAPMGAPVASLSGAESLAAEAAVAAASASERALPAGPNHLIGGALGGLVGGALGTAIWFAVVTLTEYQVGLIAIGVGWLVGTGVVIGAGRRGSILLLPISAVLTLAALAVSEYLIVVHFVSLELATEGTVIGLLDPIEFFFEIVSESIQADPLTLVFWGLALFAAVSVPWKLVTRSSS